MDDLEQIRAVIRKFRDERDWLQFHSPKNLAGSIVIEAAELLECFQWVESLQSNEMDEKKKAEIASEIADVAIYLLELADNLEIDLLRAVREKLRLNESRYPVDKAKGSSAKYNVR
jgi:NTP pyrophosphatase (non-canonical NTP hydrolase)